MFANKLRHLRMVLGDSRWWPFYLQRRFLHKNWRENLASLVASMRPRATELVGNTDEILRHQSVLKDVGISHLGKMLTPQQCDELRSYFSTKKVNDPYRSKNEEYLPSSDARHPDSHIAHHSPIDIVNAPYLFSLANDPLLLSIAASFLGCKPTIGYMAAWWSYHTDKGAQQAENFHRDVDDWRFLKLFVYLTDVDEKNGPHVYVSYSSASEKLRQIRRFSNEEVVSAFGKENILNLTGRAGEGFLEDTFGIHKGQPVAEGTRLLFQVVYSMRSLPYGPKKPVARFEEVELAEQGKLDPWINRVYLQK